MSITTGNARFFGRAIRLIFGIGALALIYPSIRRAQLEHFVGIAGWLVAITAFYVALHWMIQRFVPGLNRWVGAILANGPAIFLIFFGPPIAQVTALIYVGASLVLDAVSGDAGCEVMAIPGLLFGRRTHLPCIAFSPIDWIEDKIATRWQANQNATR